MNNTTVELLADLHSPNARQGPGGDTETRLAMQLAGLDRSRKLRIADIGCGTGASALLLAEELDADLIAIDLLPEFLAVLRRRVSDRGLENSITPMLASMETLPFADQEFDVIWSEGAVYNMGFEESISTWRRFLKPGGKLVVSEITWLGRDRPAAVESFWQAAYPGIDVASAKIRVLERHGFTPIAYFSLPVHCWMDNYYEPLQQGFGAFLERQGHSEVAAEIIAAEEAEIALYRQYREYYSYGFFIASKHRSRG